MLFHVPVVACNSMRTAAQLHMPLALNLSVILLLHLSYLRTFLSPTAEMGPE